MAYELGHVLQQRVAPVQLSRRCGRALGPVPADCVLVSRPITGERFLFARGCDDFLPGEQGRLERFARAIDSTASVWVLGLASLEGPADLNESLSCHRARVGEQVLYQQGVSPAQIASVQASGGVPPAHDPRQRAVVISAEPYVPQCGPDVADWYVTQVTMATSDPAVLAIRADIAAADVIARRHVTTAQAVAEGGTAGAVVAQETRMTVAGTPPPPRTAAATAQIAGGTVAGATATRALMGSPLDAAEVSIRITRAALAWTALVNHGARYDFKAHVMRSPRTAHCPDASCSGTVTICHGAAPQNCYLTDLPGNFFYAQIGRFVGWSERTLQLGSQLAQLTGTGGWDPPQDTAAIHFGYALPIPMTRSVLCAGLPATRMRLTSRSGCADCAELATAGHP